MRTVFIVFSRGFVTRNILRTDVFRLLTDQQDVKLVLFVPKHPPAAFLEEVRHPRVTVEECGEISYGRLRRALFEPILLHLAYSVTTRFMVRREGRIREGEQVQRERSWPTYILLHLLYSTLARSRTVKRMFRWIEFHVFPDRVFDRYIERYKPDLVFAPAIASKRDTAMVKAARRHGVRTVGMTRGWDNLDRLFLPVPPDTLLVQTELMKQIAVTKHDIPAERIRPVGFPQFDLYSEPAIYRPREEFLRSLGLDPARKVILYGSEGPWGPHDEHIVRILHRMVVADAFPFPCSLIIRPYFSHASDERFQEFKDAPHCHLDTERRVSDFFPDRWDPPRTEMEHLANMFKHMDALVCMSSTLALEAALFDKPIVNVDFYADTEPDRGPYFGRWYGSAHYGGVVRTGGVRLAKSPEGLRDEIAAYLLHPERDRAERGRLAKQYCFATDGRAGERVAAALFEALEKRNG